jgi:hypothetical protein
MTKLLYALLAAGPRWGPTLSGFEMFKLGAQYRDEVQGFQTGGYQGCTGSLRAIPRMVELLAETGSAGTKNLGSIGYDQGRIAKGRPG